MPETLLICADASFETGYGHLYRSLLVADTCQRRLGIQLRAVLPPGHDGALLAMRSVEYTFQGGAVAEQIMAVAKPDDGPVLIDTYKVMTPDLLRLEQAGYRVVMFDDGNRLGTYNVDILIDSAPGADDYGYRGSDRTVFLLGPKFFPLREEFRRAYRKQACGSSPRIVVSFGGSDPDDMTSIAYRALAKATELQQTYVLGAGYRGAMLTETPRSGATLIRDTKEFASVLATADLVLSGAGGTALEAASMGLPLILVVLSEDQRRQAMNLADSGAAVIAGGADTDQEANIFSTVSQLLDGKGTLERITKKGASLVDGEGAARIADIVKEQLL